MTPRERAKIYRRAAEIVFEKKHMTSCCLAICDIDSKYYNMKQLPFLLEFPELAMFHQPNVLFWWPEADWQSRINALVLCECLALDAA